VLQSSIVYKCFITNNVDSGSESNEDEYEDNIKYDKETSIIDFKCKLTKGHEGYHDNLVPMYDAIPIE
jgi:hypothetical protein